MKDRINAVIAEFNAKTHGSSSYGDENFFVIGKEHTYAPLSYVSKEVSEISDVKNLQENGYECSSLLFLPDNLDHFSKWYQRQFGKKLLKRKEKEVTLVHYPAVGDIFDTVEVVHKCYQILQNAHIIKNGKNLPAQLGEWYAKTIFGLYQEKSSSQRGFDFHFSDGKLVEVKVHWHDATSLKGVKIRKSLLELSDYTIIMYVAKNFLIRDILFLDSDFVLRKFGGKGHTIFLKDSDVANYFFSKSDKHYSKIVNKNNLLKFSGPNFAMKLHEKFEKIDEEKKS